MTAGRTTTIITLRTTTGVLLQLRAVTWWRFHLIGLSDVNSKNIKQQQNTLIQRHPGHMTRLTGDKSAERRPPIPRTHGSRGVSVSVRTCHRAQAECWQDHWGSDRSVTTTWNQTPIVLLQTWRFCYEERFRGSFTFHKGMVPRQQHKQDEPSSLWNSQWKQRTICFW